MEYHVAMGYYGVDAEYLQTMGIDLIAGRLLGDRFAARSGSAIRGTIRLAVRGVNVVINRAAAA
jgi:putative ABC transport system permease protein